MEGIFSDGSYGKAAMNVGSGAVVFLKGGEGVVLSDQLWSRLDPLRYGYPLASEVGGLYLAKILRRVYPRLKV